MAPNRILKLILALFLLGSSPALAGGERCEQALAKNFLDRIALAQFIIKNKLQDHSYSVRWKSKSKEFQGPLAGEGEFFVLLVADNRPSWDVWIKEVAEHTIGIGILSLPQHNPQTAVLRVGSDVYSYTTIRGERLEASTGFDGIIPVDKYPSAWVEATFQVTAKEMSAIRSFLKARIYGRITAKKDLPRLGIQEGDILNPDFDNSKFTLKKESCAGACTSFIDPKWLEHYDNPEGKKILENLARRLDLKPTFVDKRGIWENSRNPNLLSLTLVNGTGDLLPQETDLMKNNQWGTLRGLPVYGIIPDSTTGKSKTFESTREPVANWLGRYTGP